MKSLVKSGYDALIKRIGFLLEQGRRQAVVAVNKALVRTYWEIGRQVIEYEQEGKERAPYGESLLLKISKDLKALYGKGFSRSNLQYMRLLFLKYPIYQTLSGKLSWSNLVELLSIEGDNERLFYEKQCIDEDWSVRELSRQINSALFHRLTLSKGKGGVLRLSRKGHIIENSDDLVRDPYILEFLKIPEGHHYSEKELEQKLVDNLQMFLLELGKGFTFVKRQFRITIDNTHYYVDLVFYHRILKCFVLIDLKSSKVTPQDIGQMNMYLNYFKLEENSETENEPIGIVLSAKKNSVLVQYAIGSITNKLFVSKYALYLPDKNELEKRLKHLLESD